MKRRLGPPGSKFKKRNSKTLVKGGSGTYRREKWGGGRPDIAGVVREKGGVQLLKGEDQKGGSESKKP